MLWHFQLAFPIHPEFFTNLIIAYNLSSPPAAFNSNDTSGIPGSFAVFLPSDVCITSSFLMWNIVLYYISFHIMAPLICLVPGLGVVFLSSASSFLMKHNCLPCYFNIFTINVDAFTSFSAKAGGGWSCLQKGIRLKLRSK